MCSRRQVVKIFNRDFKGVQIVMLPRVKTLTVDLKLVIQDMLNERRREIETVYIKI